MAASEPQLACSRTADQGLIGSAVIVLLPDAWQLLEHSDSTLDSDLVWLFCAVGFLSFYLLERGSLAKGSTRLAGLGGAIGLATHSFFAERPRCRRGREDLRGG